MCRLIYPAIPSNYKVARMLSKQTVVRTTIVHPPNQWNSLLKCSLPLVALYSWKNLFTEAQPTTHTTDIILHVTAFFSKL